MINMEEDKYLIVRKEFNTQEMVSKYPPKIFSNNKKIVYNIACIEGCIHNGTLGFSKWSTFDLPDEFIIKSNFTQVTMQEDIFQYTTNASNIKTTNPKMEWYINFADRNLFFAYGGGLFAQDEMQVAEHPALASLKENLVKLELIDPRFGPYTRDSNSYATPILIKGVERRIAISVESNSKEGRPYGLYGNKFSGADPEIIKKALRKIEPPTITNLIAMEAPKYGRGEYTLKKIKEILTTAYTSFRAAKMESIFSNTKSNENEVDTKVIINTGNWGTGAYGGNKTLMALLQIFAAKLASIDKLIYHTFSKQYTEKFYEAKNILANEIIKNHEKIQVNEVLNQIKAMNFKWGNSDGN